MDPIYLDHAATTPLAPEVRDAMAPYLSTIYGNPSSAYASAREARKAIDRARDEVAAVLGCLAAEIVFTSGGTESDNLAIKGVALASRERSGGRRHLITSAIEHHAVLNTMRFLERYLGFDVTVVGVDADGRVDPAEVEEALRPETVLVSVMLANNEIGTVEPIAAIGERVRARGIAFHTDAVQGAAGLDLDVDRLGVDLLSLSAHKFNGPKGVGILYVRRGTEILPQQQGGGQERGLRAGTENTAGIVGAAVALQRAADQRDAYREHCTSLRDALIEGTLSAVPEARLTGAASKRLANHASFAFHEADGEALLMALDTEGVEASIGSACTSGTLEVSHVLEAVGLSDDWAAGSLRLTLGLGNTRAELERVLRVLPDAVERARAARRMTVG
jgi:cysteine desulfurase